MDMKRRLLGGSSLAPRILAAVGLSVILVMTAPTLAVNQHTASYLLDLYLSARSDLISLLKAYLSSGAVGSGLGTGSASTSSPAPTPSNTSTSTAAANTSSSPNSSSTGTGGYTTVTSTGTTTGVRLSTQVPSWCADIDERINSTLQLADQFALAANVSMQSGNYALASKQALKALNLIGKAYVKLSLCMSAVPGSITAEGNTSATLSLSPEANASVSAGTGAGAANATGWLNHHHNLKHQGAGLISAILRHEIRLSRLKAALRKAGEFEVNVSQGWSLSQQAEDLLRRAREAALAGNSSSAAQMLKEANEIISELITYLRATSAVALEHKSMWLHGHGHNASRGPGAGEGVREGEGGEHDHGMGHWSRWSANHTGNLTMTGHRGSGGSGHVAGGGAGAEGRASGNWTITPGFGPGGGEGHEHGHDHGHEHERGQGHGAHNSMMGGWIQGGEDQDSEG